MMKVSIIVPVYNEMRFIAGLCDDIDAQTFSPEQTEVLFLDGRSDDGTREYLDGRALRAHKRVITNEQRKHVYALNLGLKEAQGEYILRMDGHSGYAPDYVEKCVALLEEDENAINVGGPARARGYDFGSSVFAKVFSSKFGLGGSSFRYATGRMKVDTLFPGAWRREQLQKTGGWDETQLTSQDIEMSARLKELYPEGYFLVDPAIELWYYPRNRLGAVVKQYYRYGYWRMYTVDKHPELFRKAFFVPLALFIATIVGLIWAIQFAFIAPAWVWLGFAPLIVYLLYTCYASFTFLRGEKQKFRRFFYGIAALFAVHYPWAAGFFKRLIESRVFGKDVKDVYG